VRRKRAEVDIVPSRLRVFEWQEWGGSPRDALTAWRNARKEFALANPTAWGDVAGWLWGYANVRAKSRGERPVWPREDEGQVGLR
jgi:hypothetical protein